MSLYNQLSPEPRRSPVPFAVKLNHDLASAPELTPDVSIILVTYNNSLLIERLRDSITAAATGLKVQIICIDNSSRDGTAEVVRRLLPEAELIESSENVGFGRANNRALKRARGRYVLLLNTDAFMAPDSLRNCIDLMEHELRCGLIGGRLVGEDGSDQPSCRSFPTPVNVLLSELGLGYPRWIKPIDDPALNLDVAQECDWVPGCFYFLRRAALESVGGFDPRYFMYYEEVDHCRALRKAGWVTMFVPSVLVVHLGGESSRTEGLLNAGKQLTPLQVESELLYFRKHFGGLETVAWLIAKLTLLSLKWVRRRIGGDKESANSLWAQKHLFVRLFFKTQFATRPTR